MRALAYGIAAAVLFVSGVSAQGPELPPAGSRPPVSDQNDPTVRFRSALRAMVLEPKQTGTTPANELLADITVENLCGAGSLNEAARRFINERTNNWVIRENRAVALTATISFAEASAPALATIPLILLVPEGTKASDGTEIKNNISCNPVILGSIPKDQPLTIKLELKFKQGEFRFTDGPIKALDFIGKALNTAALLGPHTAAAGHGVLAFSAALAPLTQATNEFLKLFGDEGTDIPTLYRWDRTKTRLEFKDGRTTRLALVKTFKKSTLNFTPSEPETMKAAINTKFGTPPADHLQLNYNKANTEYGAFSADPTIPRFKTFCIKLQSELESAYSADPSVVPVAIYYHHYKQQQDLADKRLTCLTASQVKLLRDMGVTQEPYPGAYGGPSPTPPPGTPSVSSEEFDVLKEMLEAFAGTIKSAQTRFAAEKNQVRAELTEFFDSKVITANWIQGEPLLMPSSERGVPLNVVLDYFEKWAQWGPISRFGCFAKPQAAADLAKGVTGETLMLFPDRKVMALVQVSKVPKKEKFLALELSVPTKEDVDRLMDKRESCGRGANKWDPRVDFNKLYPAVVANR
jgi:hypothetical protein